MHAAARPIPSRLALLAVAIGALALTTAATMNWPDLLDRPRPHASAQISYGMDPLQHVDLWLPAGPGPYPVVLMVHGGCWQTDIAEADIMNYIADDLRSHGIAVWNIEYRGIDRPGGGYPGTFQDVAKAADLLATAGAKYRLKTDRIVAIGHSAGGHLALWLAARSRVPATSALHSPHPLPLATVISIGGLPDLEAAQIAPGDTCGAFSARAMAGKPGKDRPNVYRDTSPAAMMPFPGQQILVNATRDGIAPPAFADAYAAKARAAGGQVRRIVIPDEGHVELIAPGSAAWAAERAEIERALGLSPR